jgi:hypothetical protein
MEQVLLSSIVSMSLLLSLPLLFSISSHGRARKFPAVSFSLSLSLSLCLAQHFQKNRLGVKPRFFLCDVPIL